MIKLPIYFLYVLIVKRYNWSNIHVMDGLNTIRYELTMQKHKTTLWSILRSWWATLSPFYSLQKRRKKENNEKNFSRQPEQSVLYLVLSLYRDSLIQVN